MTYLRLTAERAKIVTESCRRMGSHPDDQDCKVEAGIIRELMTDFPADSYDAATLARDVTMLGEKSSA